MVKNILFLLIFGWQLLLANIEIPTLTRRVTDQTNTLIPSELEYLETTLRNYEDTTSNQIVVLIISTLNDYPIEDYCIKVVEKNKIGQKGKDNGILLFIAKDDREVRIEVGYGLEGVITDAISGTIIRNIIVPNFRKNNFYSGIKEAIETLQKAIGGEFKADGTKKSNEIPFIVLVIIVILLSIFFSRIRRYGNWTYYGGGWNSGWRSRGSGWGGFGGFGGFGSGGGFGGFSGGGGSFGGGGASGRW